MENHNYNKLIPFVIHEGKERPITLVSKDKHRLRMNITITTSGTPDDDTDRNMTIICSEAIHSSEDHTWTLGIEQLDMLAFYATDPAVSSPIAPEPTSNSGWDGALVMTVNDDRAAPTEKVLFEVTSILKNLKNTRLEKYIEMLKQTLCGCSAEDILALTTWDFSLQPFNITCFRDRKDLEIFLQSGIDNNYALEMKQDNDNFESQYKRWKTDDILKWLSCLKNDKYDLLKKGVIESEISGYHLPYLTLMELSLPPFNIKHFRDRKDFREKFILLKLKHDNDTENGKIKECNVDESKYKIWTIDEVLKWVCSLENNRYEIYSDVLKNGFIESEITGKDIPSLTRVDLILPPFNIKNFKDRKDLEINFKRLEAKYG
eukprot:456440_1